jgi:6-phospho-beta-glucosidase
MTPTKPLTVAVIGAGSTYTPELVDGFLRRAASLPVAEFRFMDIDPEKLTVVGGLALRMVASGPRGGLPGGQAYRAPRAVLTQNLDDALRGADFVLTQIRVGRLDARVMDETIPLSHGLIGQETTGIGGHFKALRTIPVLLGIARRMEMLCPQAWLINFTNPAGIVTEALLKHSKVRALGLCNVPFNMLREARERLPEDAGEAEIDYIGLNHLSWITGIRSGSKDWLPDQLAGDFARYRPANIPALEFPAELLTRVGAIPSSYLQYFYFPARMLAELQAEPKSRGLVCQEIEAELLETYRDPALREKPAALEKRGGAWYSEVAVALVDAIANDRRERHIVNVRNGSTLPWLPAEAVIETTCLVGVEGAAPLPLSPSAQPTRHIAGLMSQVKDYEQLTVEAAVTGSRDAALHGLYRHPLVADWDKAAACFDELLEAHRPWLPAFASAAARDGGRR